MHTSILCIFFLANTQVNVKFTLKKNVGKNKKTYLEIKESKINLKVESVKLNFDNLFNGNKELGKFF